METQFFFIRNQKQNSPILEVLKIYIDLKELLLKYLKYDVKI